MNTYKKYAFAIQILNVVIMLFVPFLTVTKWFYPSFYKFINVTPELDSNSFTWGQKLSGFAFESISLILLVVGLLFVNRLMTCIQQNEYFSINTISILKKITKISLIYACYNPILGSILSVITSLNNKPGERIISLTIGSHEILNIMIFCFIFLIMTIFQKGYEIKHEQELTI